MKIKKKYTLVCRNCKTLKVLNSLSLPLDKLYKNYLKELYKIPGYKINRITALIFAVEEALIK